MSLRYDITFDLTRKTGANLQRFTTIEDAEAIATQICRMPTAELSKEIKTIHKELQTTRSKMIELSAVLIVNMKLHSLGILKLKQR